MACNTKDLNRETKAIGLLCSARADMLRFLEFLNKFYVDYLFYQMYNNNRQEGMRSKSFGLNVKNSIRVLLKYI